MRLNKTLAEIVGAHLGEGLSRTVYEVKGRPGLVVKVGGGFPRDGLGSQSATEVALYRQANAEARRHLAACRPAVTADGHHVLFMVRCHDVRRRYYDTRTPEERAAIAPGASLIAEDDDWQSGYHHRTRNLVLCDYGLAYLKREGQRRDFRAA